MVKKLATVLVALAVFACARHDDLPPSPADSGLITSPPPDTLVVTVLDPDAPQFRLDWTIGDDTAVSFYRVYQQYLAIPEFEVRVLQDTTYTKTFDTDTTLLFTGFGVSSVSLGNIESAIVGGPAQ